MMNMQQKTDEHSSISEQNIPLRSFKRSDEAILVTVASGVRQHIVATIDDIQDISHINFTLGAYAAVLFTLDYYIPDTQTVNVTILVDAGLSSNFTMNSVMQGSGHLVLNATFRLTGTHAQTHMFLTTKTTGAATCALVTHQHHCAPSTQSTVIIRQALGDESSVRYQSMVHMTHNAQKAAAHQSHKALLLDSKAHASVQPELQVLDNKEVKCSHGTAISHLSTLLLWYCRTRGISVELAKELLIESFLNNRS
jgi:Fe-S cluster assembly scaffold protein SufB